MGSRHATSRWKWPLCSSAAVGILLLIVFGVPDRWIEAFFSPLGPLDLPPPGAAVVLEILPVPAIEVAPPRPRQKEREPPREVPASWNPDPQWWAAVWRLRWQEEEDALLGRSRPDSIVPLPQFLVPMVALLKEAPPDTSREMRLALYRLREQERFGVLKPYLLGRARNRLYRDLQNQAARLFGEFLYEEISVPDPDRVVDRP